MLPHQSIYGTGYVYIAGLPDGGNGGSKGAGFDRDRSTSSASNSSSSNSSSSSSSYSMPGMHTGSIKMEFKSTFKENGRFDTGRMLADLGRREAKEQGGAREMLTKISESKSHDRWDSRDHHKIDRPFPGSYNASKSSSVSSKEVSPAPVNKPSTSTATMLVVTKEVDSFIKETQHQTTLSKEQQEKGNQLKKQLDELKKEREKEYQTTQKAYTTSDNSTSLDKALLDSMCDKRNEQHDLDSFSERLAENMKKGTSATPTTTTTTTTKSSTSSKSAPATPIKPAQPTTTTTTTTTTSTSSTNVITSPILPTTTTTTSSSPFDKRDRYPSNATSSGSNPNTSNNNIIHMSVTVPEDLSIKKKSLIPANKDYDYTPITFSLQDIITQIDFKKLPTPQTLSSSIQGHLQACKNDEAVPRVIQFFYARPYYRPIWKRLFHTLLLSPIVSTLLYLTRKISSKCQARVTSPSFVK